MNQQIDWKATGYLAGGILAVLATLKKILTPFAVDQVRDAMQPEFDKVHKRLTQLETSIAGLQQEQNKLAVENAYLRGKAGI